MREETVLRAGVAVGATLAALVVAALPARGASGMTHDMTGETPSPAPTASTVIESPTPAPTPPADATPTPTASQTPTETPPADDRLLPDLVALAASKPRVQVVGDGRLLRFQSALGNIGRGPVEVRPDRTHACPAGQQNSTQIIYRDRNGNGRYNRSTDTGAKRHRAGCMVYHPSHRHWHFQASARYTLLDPSQEQRVVVAARRKVSFCLRDSARVPPRYGTFRYGGAYGSCTKSAPQGISVGWMDVYQSWLAGQSLRLPKNLRNGIYCIETTVDPLDQLLESNNKNNKSVRAVAIRDNQVAVYDSSRCRR